jgi:nucleotide-binding universal stress UspA family protein
MTYKTLMVHLEIGHPNKSLLCVTQDLAARFGAKVIGIAAGQRTPMVYTDGYNPSAFIAMDLTEIDREINVTKEEFHAAFKGGTGHIEWLSATIYESIADYVSRECRSADLLITSGLSLDKDDISRSAKPGDIVMQAGRPVLVVPRTMNTSKFDHIAVAWKDTRESRRAIFDALPLLKLATEVTVVEIAHRDERERMSAHLIGVCNWLKSHGIAADHSFVASTKDGDSDQLNAAVEALGADLLIAGAYGHSRLREWALGGVTHDLMLKASYCTLLSH